MLSTSIVSMLTVRNLHILCVSLTMISFIIRGIWRIFDHHWLHQKWVKQVPHVIDTVLLGSGIYLALHLHQYPFTHDWLTAKFFGLVTYILLGNIALKRSTTKTLCLLSWLAALVVFFYIVSVARTRLANPLWAWSI